MILCIELLSWFDEYDASWQILSFWTKCPRNNWSISWSPSNAKPLKIRHWIFVDLLSVHPFTFYRELVKSDLPESKKKWNERKRREGVDSGEGGITLASHDHCSLLGTNKDKSNIPSRLGLTLRQKIKYTSLDHLWVQDIRQAVGWA